MGMEFGCGDTQVLLPLRPCWLVACIAGAAAQDEDSSDIAGTLQDAIVGTWVGEAAQGETEFETRLTFVSPKGGVSRYPSFVRAAACWPVIARATTTNSTRSITWGGMDEKADGCIQRSGEASPSTATR